MYPETDVPSILVTKKLLDSVPLPPSKEERVKKLKSLGLYKELINSLALSPQLELFYNLTGQFNKLKPVLIAKIIVEVPKEIKRRFGKDISVLTDEHFAETISLVNSGLILEEAVLPLLNRVCASPNLSPKDIAVDYKVISDSELESIASHVIRDNPSLSEKVIMGLVMKKVSGRVLGKKVNELVLRLLGISDKEQLD